MPFGVDTRNKLFRRVQAKPQLTELSESTFSTLESPETMKSTSPIFRIFSTPFDFEPEKGRDTSSTLCRTPDRRKIGALRTSLENRTKTQSTGGAKIEMLQLFLVSEF